MNLQIVAPIYPILLLVLLLSQYHLNNHGASTQQEQCAKIYSCDCHSIICVVKYSVDDVHFKLMGHCIND